MNNVHSRGTHPWARLGTSVAVLGLIVSLTVPSALAGGSSPTTTTTVNPIVHARILVARLSAKLAQEEDKSEALDQQYVGVVSSLKALNRSIKKFEAAVIIKELRFSKTSKVLVKSLIRSFVDGEDSQYTIPLLNLNVTQGNAQQIFENQVQGNLDELEAKLNREKRSLERTLRAESVQRDQAAADATQIRSLILENEATAADTQLVLSKVSTSLSLEIVNYEVAVAIIAARAGNTQGVENAVAAASAVGGQKAANRVIAAANAAVVKKKVVTGTAAGSKQGLAAVRAAETQIGVPYVWGGETKGKGFDCSGLTQWSWAQAGFTIPRTAAEQHDALTPVPLNALKPGDLMFYYNLDGDNEVDHVVMYVGSGPYGTNTIIAAAHTGTLVGFEPLFTYGLIGAGVPSA